MSRAELVFGLIVGSRCISCSVLGEIGEHAVVDDVGEVTLEDTHGLLLGAAPLAGVVKDLLGARFAAPLCNRHSVQYGVDSTVPSAIEAMPHGCSPSPSAEEAGSGAVPLNRAKPPSPAKRRGSPTSTSSSATERSASPHSSPRVEPARAISLASSVAISDSWRSSSAMRSRWRSSRRKRRAVAASWSMPRSRRSSVASRTRTSATSGSSARTLSGSSQISDSASLSMCWRLVRVERRALCHKASSSLVSSGPLSLPARLNATGMSGSAWVSRAIRTESNASVLPCRRFRADSAVRVGFTSRTC